jgi:hypothetical protein
MTILFKLIRRMTTMTGQVCLMTSPRPSSLTQLASLIQLALKLLRQL